MYREELAKLSNQELIALVLAEASQIEELTRRIAELETKLVGHPRPRTTSRCRHRRGASPTGPSAERRTSERGVPACCGRLLPIRIGSLPALQNTARTASSH
jgi:hypothetical protein